MLLTKWWEELSAIPAILDNRSRKRLRFGTVSRYVVGQKCVT